MITPRSPLTLALLSLGAALSFSARDLDAQLVVGNDQTGVATIYEIHVGTGVATPIYSSSTTDAKPWGMAYDPSSNTLYWNNGGTLYSSPYGPTLTPTSVPLTYNSGTVNYVALAFRNGKLLGTRNIATEAVYEIDPATGVGNLVYTYPSTLDFGGLEVDDTTGLLYGLSDSGQRGLHRIDVPGQSTSLLFGYPGAETDLDGLAVHGGRAYLVSDGPNFTQTSFYVYDVASATQIGTLPSPFTASGTFCAATFIAPRGRLLGVDDSRNLYSVDATTGTSSQIATVSANAGTTAALAFDAETHVLYLSSTSNAALYILDPSTGQATLIGAYGIPSIAMHGLEYDARNRVLYGVSSHDGGLYRIDVNSGAATLVGLTGLAGELNLGYAVGTDTLYATDAGTDSLHTLDRSTGAATLVGALNGASSPSGLALNASQATMYLVENAPNRLRRVNLATGASTEIGATGSGNLVGLVHIPRGASIVRRNHGCGATEILASGAAALGASFSVQLTAAGVSAIGIGLTSFEFPLCTCVLGHDWSTSVPGPSLTVTLPNDPLLVGGVVALQGIDLGVAGGCPAPLFRLTDTLVATIER
jgi:hypothetical protein